VYNALFITAYGAYDIYVLFIDKSISLLSKLGELGYITSNKYLVADYGSRLRQLLCHRSMVRELVDLTECPSTFPDVLVSPILTFCSGTPQEYTRIAVIKRDDLGALSTLPDLYGWAKDGVYEDENFAVEIRRTQDLLDDNLDQINLYLVGNKKLLVNKLYKLSDHLQSIGEIRTGIMGFAYWSLEPLVEDHSLLRPEELKLLPPSLVTRYENLWGVEPVDLYKKKYQFPVLRRDLTKINQSTWHFFRKPKVVVRGVAPRLCAILDEEGHALLVAVHGVIPYAYHHCYLTALINSRLFDWLHIGQFYGARIPQGSLRYPVSFYESLPVRRISFTTPKAEREQLAEEGKRHYEGSLKTANFAGLMEFMDGNLSKRPGDTTDSELEQSDVVHDLLAFLAQEMTRLNKEKQAEVRRYLSWLESYLGVSVEELKNKTRVKEYWKPEAMWDKFRDALVQNKRTITKVKLPGYQAEQPIREGFNGSRDKLQPLLDRIQRTDSLIDQIVYRLYGLTEDEIAIVEGRA
jgi:hypothetical protein